MPQFKSLFPLKNLALTTTFLALAQTNYAAPGGPGNNIELVMQDLQQKIKEDMKGHDLRRDGLYDFRETAKSIGLVQVKNLDSAFPQDGGGQNGAFSYIDKKERTMQLSFSPTWVMSTSYIYCNKGAVEMVMDEYTKSDVFHVIAGRENECLEIASSSTDIGHHKLLQDSFLLEEIENYQNLKNQQTVRAREKGLFPSESLLQERRKCNEAYEKTKEATSECRKNRDQIWEVTKIRRNDPEFSAYDHEMGRAFSSIDVILDVLLANAKDHPEIIDFLIEIQPK